MGDDFDPDQPGRILTNLRADAVARGWCGRVFIVTTRVTPYHEMIRWCEEQFGPGMANLLHDWHPDHVWDTRMLDDCASDLFTSRFAFAFRSEADAVLFALHWSEWRIESSLDTKKSRRR